jgi:hypothetical protein
MKSQPAYFTGAGQEDREKKIQESFFIFLSHIFLPGGILHAPEEL